MSNIKFRAKVMRPVKIAKIIIFKTKGCFIRNAKTETKKVIIGAMKGANILNS
jgi:hypothetical protein